MQRPCEWQDYCFVANKYVFQELIVSTLHTERKKNFKELDKRYYRNSELTKLQYRDKG